MNPADKTTDAHSLLTSALADLTSSLDYYQKTSRPIAAPLKDIPTNVIPKSDSGYAISDHQILGTNSSRVVGENAFDLGFRSGRIYQGAYQRGYHRGFIEGLCIAIVDLENIIRHQTEKLHQTSFR